MARVINGVNTPSPGEWTSSLSKNRIADYKTNIAVDGPGFRNSLYVSGCPFKCLGCFNSPAQSFAFGREFNSELEDRIINDLDAPLITGFSILGGEPMLATGILIPLVEKIIQRYEGSKSIWVWSGYTFEALQSETPDKLRLLELCDVLVDGPFIQSQFNPNLAFRGSENQRIIDLRESLETGETVDISHRF